MKDIAKICAKKFDELSIDYCLIGAFCRDLIFKLDEVGTVDVDFSIIVDSWDEYEKVIESFVVNYGAKKNPKKEYRIQIGKVDADIIPCGKVGNHETLVWPKTKLRLKIMAFKEAIASAIIIKIDEQPVKVLHPAFFLALKIFSWSSTTRAKDGKDIVNVLKDTETWKKYEINSLADIGTFWKAYLKEDHIFYLKNASTSDFSIKKLLMDANEGEIPEQVEINNLKNQIENIFSGLHI